MDTGYDITRLAYVPADLPVELVGRLRSDRVMLREAGPRRSKDHAGPPHRRRLHINHAQCNVPATTSNSCTN